jgi:hypothetical protein
MEVNKQQEKAWTIFSLLGIINYNKKVSILA